MGREMPDYESRRMAVVDQVLSEPHLFDMKGWGARTSCGTVACLAGTAVLQAEQKGLCTVKWASTAMSAVVNTPDGFIDLDWFAADYLGMSDTGLFYSVSLTAEQAAKRLLEEPYAS